MLHCVVVVCARTCVALCYTVLRGRNGRPCAHECVAVNCSVFQCVAVCCSVLQCVAMRCGVLQCVCVGR